MSCPALYFEDWVNLCLKTMGIDVGEGVSAKETVLSSPPFTL